MVMPWQRVLMRLYRGMPTWLRVVLAVASVALGAVIVIRPTTALDVLALLMGGAMVLTGILEPAERVSSSRREPLRLLLSALWIAGGLFVLISPALTVRLVAALVGGLLLLNGFLGLLGVFREDSPWDRRIADAAFSLSGLLFGALALTWPDITLLVVAVVFGAWLIMRGVADLWTIVRARRDAASSARFAPVRRWGRTVVALGAVALAVATVGLTAPLREGSPVVDEFYAAPRDVPDEPGRLVRAEEFTRDVPADARGWRILYTTTGMDGGVRVASGLVVVPAEGDGDWPVVDWNHGTTGFAEHCAPSLQVKPFWSGAMFVLREVIANGWALVATDYIGLGTEGPHPYLIGPPSAYASLDAVRAARELDDADLSTKTVVWGHSQGGGAALWTGALAREYAPDVFVRGVAALAPAADPAALVGRMREITGGSIFAAFAFASYEAVYSDVRYRDYIRPGVETIVRAMADRCLSDPGTVLSVVADLGSQSDPQIFARPPTSGPLGQHLSDNRPPERGLSPVLVMQGGRDSVITPATQQRLVGRMCEAGMRVDYRLYEGYEHVELVELRRERPVADLLEWTAARFEGRLVPRGCAEQVLEREG
ncbi:lipase family protein [Microbacterium sp. No. 7]|uniref:lipase family protein n=1 Tax=Microbacterium sp. No. 7 TaxID=1714373 RepID=UPI0006CFC295|nr:lipase family protein [Microbacterium sp. No. 7]ALJ21807.1 hypothetical protein AOA12_18660 [Microbacterium sp. No. 7]